MVKGRLTCLIVLDVALVSLLCSFSSAFIADFQQGIASRVNIKSELEETKLLI